MIYDNIKILNLMLILMMISSSRHIEAAIDNNNIVINILFLYDKMAELRLFNVIRDFVNEKKNMKFNIIPIQVNQSKTYCLFQVVNALSNSTRIHVVIGPNDDNSAQVVNLLLNSYNIIHIGYKWLSTIINNEPEFNNLINVMPSKLLSNDALIEIIKFFKWKRVAIVTNSDPDVYILSRKMTDKIHDNNISVTTTQIYLTNASSAIKILKESDSRIFLNYPYFGNTTHSVECELYSNNLYGSAYQWLVSGYMDLNSSHCEQYKLLQAVEGTIYVSETIEGSIGKDQEFYNYLKTNYATNSNLQLTKDEDLLIDCIWTLYLGLNQTRKSDFNQFFTSTSYFDFSSSYYSIIEQIKNVSFGGYSGSVKFKENGKRIAKTIIYQIKSLSFIKVGEYDPTKGLLTFIENVWFKNGVPPLDHTEYKNFFKKISQSVFIVVLTIAAIQTVFAIAMIVFNERFKNIKYIKMSSPRLNSLICIGCIFCFISLIPIGFYPQDNKNLETYSWICHMRIWLLTLGFDLCFGSLFSKTWRVHMIFSNKNVTSKFIIKDYHLFIMVGLISLLDIIVLIIWEFADTINWKTTKAALSEYNGVVEQLVYIECYSTHQTYFMVAIYAMKGILLIFGIYFAWETRNVHIESLNDSKQIAISIYNVVLLSTITVSLMYVLNEDQMEIKFIIISFSVILCVGTILGLIFIPKLIKLSKPQNSVDSHIERFSSHVSTSH